MSTTPAAETDHTLSDVVAGEVRAELARRGLSLRAFARQLDVPEHWAVRRLAAGRSVPLTLEDLELIAGALGLSPTWFLLP